MIDLISNITAFIQTPLFGSVWMPEAATGVAREVDKLFFLIFWTSVVFFVLITIVMIYFIVRFRRRKGVDPEPSPQHSTFLELLWTIIPLIILIVVFYIGFQTFINIATPPSNAYEVDVTGQKWSWSFTYPNGHIDGELHVPAGTPVLLTMTSEDVIHSLYIPDFRIKQDVLPGRYTWIWFEAEKPGEHVLFCAEYCGTGHSTMNTTVFVHSEAEFENWLANAANYLDTLPPAEAGLKLFVSRGCAQCHSTDGKGKVGPSMKGIYNEVQMMKDGSKIIADENYLRESILDPQAKIVMGYDPVMPTYKGRLKDKEITAIIACIKSLNETVEIVEEEQ